MKPNYALITLLTDFGDLAPYAAEVKGHILKQCKYCNIVEITNKIKPYDLMQAGLWLKKVAPSFPENTIHLFSVDPGVGSKRKPIIVRFREQYFVGPDNGILSIMIEDQPYKAYEIKTTGYKGSATFQGRDLFAPIAGKLAAGYPISRLGKPIKKIIELQPEKPRISLRPKSVIGKVIFVDQFGNIETNISKKELKRFKKPMIYLENRKISGFYSSFSEIPEGQLGLIINCYGFLEIVMNQQSARKTLKIKEKDSIQIREA